MLLLEMGMIVIAVILAIFKPDAGARLLAPIERKLAFLARKPRLAVVVVGATALLLRVSLLPIFPVPVPAVHDEFSYLLAADTFAHGQMANPTHPMWIHFESFHVNQKPTYVSMYYPAQGLFLGAGQVLFGHPFWGVWLSTGIMCAAICWMLQGWFPPLWALIGGLLAVIRLGTLSYWMNTYWGGSVAALGGALVLGALPRIKRSQRILDTVLLALGLAILANSRPYEGLFFSLPILVALAIWLRDRTAPRRRVLLKTVFPLLFLCVLTLSLMGCYFWRTTGAPFHSPYYVNSVTYRPVPFFPWQHITRVPTYNNPELHNLYTGVITDQYNFARSHPLFLILGKAWSTWAFYFGPLLTLPLLAACFVLPYGITFRQLSRRTKLMIAVCGTVLFAAALPVCYDAHYLAPLTCVFYALVLTAMQKVRRWRVFDRATGVALVRSVPLVALAMLLVATSGIVPMNISPAIWVSRMVFRTYRADLMAKLSKIPGLHLVIVHYNSDHQPMDEWVYNSANIDHAKIVWARDLGPAQNTELLNYFSDRRVWLVEPDMTPPRLMKYKSASFGDSRSLDSQQTHGLSPEHSD